MMCFNVRRLISAYIDSELSPDEMREIRSHLFKCDACSEEYEQLKLAKSALSAIAPAEPQDDLIRLIACRPWELETSVVKHRSGRFKALLAERRWFAPIAAGIVGLSVLTAIGLGPRNSEPFRQLDRDQHLADSFEVEHERFEMTSPFSNRPTITLNESNKNIRLASRKQIESDDSEPFVVFVSERTVR